MTRIIYPSCSELKEYRNNHLKKKIVLATGCFDILHVGHIHFLKEAKKYGDLLVIGINSDASIKQLKGESRPVIPENSRAVLLHSIKYVNAVFIFNAPSASQEILELKPNYFVIGSESITLYPEEPQAAKEINAQLVSISPIQSLSTTTIISNITK